jgi:hypothetical protein
LRGSSRFEKKRQFWCGGDILLTAEQDIMKEMGCIHMALWDLFEMDEVGGR